MVKVQRNVSGIKDRLSNHELGKVYQLKPKDKITGGNADNWRLKAFKLRYNFQSVKIQHLPGRKALNFSSRQSSSSLQTLETLLPVSSTQKEERQKWKINSWQSTGTELNTKTSIHLHNVKIKMMACKEI